MGQRTGRQIIFPGCRGTSGWTQEFLGGGGGSHQQQTPNAFSAVNFTWVFQPDNT